MRRPQSGGSGEIINGLRKDARPVDRIHARQSIMVAEGEMIEHGFDMGLAIIKRALDGKRMDIGGMDGGHLPALHLADPPMRIEDKHIHLFKARKGFNRRPACIPRCRADNGGALATGFEDMIHQAAQQLHRHIFEGEGGAVKQFQHELIVADLHQRADHIMPETGIGLIDHGTEFCDLNVCGIGAEDSARNRLVRLSRKACDLGLFQRDKMLGPIKPAIPGKTG